jgi:hypothetical protein
LQKKVIHVAAKQFQIVRQITETPKQQNLGDQMERSVPHDLSEWIIQQDTMPRKPAADHHIVSFNCRVEEVRNFGK